MVAIPSTGQPGKSRIRNDLNHKTLADVAFAGFFRLGQFSFALKELSPSSEEGSLKVYFHSTTIYNQISEKYNVLSKRDSLHCTIKRLPTCHRKTHHRVPLFALVCNPLTCDGVIITSLNITVTSLPISRGMASAADNAVSRARNSRSRRENLFKIDC